MREKSRPDFASLIGLSRLNATIGARVDIVFDPLHPKRAREAGRTGLLSRHFAFLVFLAGAMVFAAVVARDAVY